MIWGALYSIHYTFGEHKNLLKTIRKTMSPEEFERLKNSGKKFMIWNLKESSVKKIILKIVFAVAAVAIVPMSAAVNAQEPSAEDLAKAAQNPIASMISLPT